MLWKLKLAFFGLLILPLAAFAQSTDLTEAERGKALKMLKGIVDAVKENYYDERLKGVDFDDLAKKAEAQIKIANKDILVYSAFADMLDALRDSHTFFIPPQPEYEYHHGWTMQMIGEKCFVTRIEKDSDALAKGLKVGDEILAFNGVRVTRKNFRDLEYFFYVLNPLRELTVEVAGTDGKRRVLMTGSKLRRSSGLPPTVTFAEFWREYGEQEKARRLANTRLFEIGKDLVWWRLDSFDLQPEEIDSLMERVRKSRDFIIDLRGNGGGYTDTLNRLVGHFFDRKINLGTRVLRNKSKPEIVSSRGGSPFKGRVVILVDSRSASASEHFARVMQLEKRAEIVGDRTMGALVTSRIFQRSVNAYDPSYFLSITIEGVVLPDGKPIEGVGITPDELMLPSATDLASNRDPVLSHAAARLGYQISPEQAFETLEKYRADLEKYRAKPEVK
jgi:C-terminal processing protease CtpA/Prc